jgi:hypothetical protein
VVGQFEPLLESSDEEIEAIIGHWAITSHRVSLGRWRDFGSRRTPRIGDAPFLLSLNFVRSCHAFPFLTVRLNRYDSFPVSMMCARSVRNPQDIG